MPENESRILRCPNVTGKVRGKIALPRNGTPDCRVQIQGENPVLRDDDRLSICQNIGRFSRNDIRLQIPGPSDNERATNTKRGRGSSLHSKRYRGSRILATPIYWHSFLFGGDERKKNTILSAAPFKLLRRSSVVNKLSFRHISFQPNLFMINRSRSAIVSPVLPFYGSH